MPLSGDAVIFDLDGVLVDSEPANEQRWREWAERRDIPFAEIEAVYHGRPMQEVIRAVAPHLDAEAETERLDDLMVVAPEKVRSFDGAAALLDGLPEGRWAIATSGRRRTATNRLRHVGLPVPEVLVTADDVANGKPAPDPYRLAAERLGVDPGRCVVLEDAPQGIEAARRAGARVVGVATSHEPEALSAADAVVPSIAAVTIEQSPDGTLRIRTG
jgi:sugar-phosphatase